MVDPLEGSSICLLLTATIQVRDGIILTARRDLNTRLDDYKKAFGTWLAHPEVRSVVLVENSGFDLSALIEIASRTPEKRVEFLSFTAPHFDGLLGKGYGEMFCLQYALEHSHLLAQSPRFIKVTGRYYLSNFSTFLRFAEARRDAEVICDMLLNLTWADSRAFLGTADFLRSYLLPLIDQVNDSVVSNFEHVMARAVHACMANRGVWAEPPFLLEIQGVSGSQDRAWKMSLKDNLKRRIRHNLFARFLSTGPM